MLTACTSSTTDIDGGDGENSDGSTDGDNGTDSRVRRELVSGTAGFCTTHGEPDMECTESSDCLAYRIPVPVDCTAEVVVLNEADCSIASRDSQVDSPECTADIKCEDVPRVCRNGVCTIELPPATCSIDEECKIVDTGCDCVALSVTVGEYMPQYGRDCPQTPACSPGAVAVCVEGVCLLAGTFMDDSIAKYCDLLDNCNLSEIGIAECIGQLEGDGYRRAAAIWILIRTTEFVETCQGMIFGPWKEVVDCMF